LSTNTAEKNTLTYRRFTKADRCSIQSLRAIGLCRRPVAFEPETRPETLETETRKNGSQDESLNSITEFNYNNLNIRDLCKLCETIIKFLVSLTQAN